MEPGRPTNYLTDFLFKVINSDEFWFAFIQQKYPSGNYQLSQYPTAKCWRDFYKLFLGPYRPCVNCHAFPIAPIRYHCMVCRDVDMCETCEKSAPHPLNHFICKIFYPEQTPLGRLRGKAPLPACTRCKEPNSGKFHEFISLEENNYFCDKCAADPASKKNASNKLWEISCATPTDVVKDRLGQNPRGAGCDIRFPGCRVSCTGINWKCMYCWATDICESCDVTYTKSVLEGKPHPKASKSTHTLKCATMKIYHMTPNYNEWGFNMTDMKHPESD